MVNGFSNMYDQNQKQILQKITKLTPPYVYLTFIADQDCIVTIETTVQSI